MKPALLAGVAVLGAIVLLAFAFFTPPRLEAVRGLTRKEVTEIHSIVHKEVWKEFRSDCARPGWWHVSGDFLAALQTRITFFDSAQGTVTVCTRTRSRPFEQGQYELQKRGNEWIITRGHRYLFSSIPAANNSMLRTGTRFAFYRPPDSSSWLIRVSGAEFQVPVADVGRSSANISSCL